MKKPAVLLELTDDPTHCFRTSDVPEKWTQFASTFLANGFNRIIDLPCTTQPAVRKSNLRLHKKNSSNRLNCPGIYKHAAN